MSKMFLCSYRHFGLILILYCGLCGRRVEYCSSEEDIKYCLPGSSCWPSLAAWSELNVSLGGRLLAPFPPASPCHDGSHRSPEACREAYDEWENPFWRGDQAGAMQSPNWEWDGNRGCPLTTDPSTPCYQGAVPVYAVEALQASHVQTAIRFAARYRVRLSIKTTGHDFSGRSTAAGSLGIWLHRLRQITFHDSFSPEGCTADAQNDSACAAWGAPAVTAEVGVHWRDLYAAVDARQRIVVGGWGDTLSTGGGYMQGGGHSPLSPMLGLCADNVLEVKVVTADRELRTANIHQNADLFWALRGGGGGTFGIVISATHRTHPPLSTVVSVRYAAEARDESSFRGLATECVKLQAALSDAGDWAGATSYVYPSQATLVVVMVYVLPNGNAASAEKAFDPIVAYARQSGGNVAMVNQTIREYSTFLEMHRDLLCLANPGVCSEHTGYNALVSSCLFPKAVLTERPSDVADAFLAILSTGAIQAISGLLVGGRAVARADVDGSAVNPAWRQALWHVALGATWEDNATLSEKAYKARLLTEMNGRYLRSLTPGSGCYLNEADLNEPDWQQSFFGANYRELRRIKRNVDPHGLFYCRTCVGSDIPF